MFAHAGNVNQKVSEVKWEKGGTYPRDAEKFGEAATQVSSIVIVWPFMDCHADHALVSSPIVA